MMDEVQARDGVSGADDMGLEDLLKEAAKKPTTEAVSGPNYETLFDSEKNHASGGVEEGVGDGAAAADGSDTNEEANGGGYSSTKDKKIAKLKEKIASLSAACPTNVKDPNFSRCGTISAIAKVILKHRILLVYMSQNIIDMEKKKGGNPSYIQIVATKLLELMSSKADPSQDSPTHYTSLKWIVAFGDAFFDANMEWVKRHDPVFGAGSYGHISWLVPEHLFVMHKQIESLKNDGWKSVPEFAGFNRAVEGVNCMGAVNKGGKEFFERLPNLFFEQFETTFQEHTKKWRSQETLPIIIAGHPQIAKAYL
jgi:hypothetical protein